MPFTISHAAAVIPFRRFCPRFLSFAGLVAGTLTPDVSYFIPILSNSSYAHTYAGSVGFCMPAGIALLLIFYLVRTPLVKLLPEPHRGALLPFCSTPRPSPWVMILSVLVGAWTHIFWDSFTHESGWFVQNWPVLRQPVFSYGSYSIELSRFIQHVSTVVGLIVLGIVYLNWLRRCRGIEQLFPRDEMGRYILCFSLLLLPGIIVLPMTWHLLHVDSAIVGFRIFLGRTAVLYCSALFILLVGLGLVLRFIGKERRSV